MVLLQYDYTNAGCTAMNKSSTFMVHVGALDYGYNLHGEVVSFISENAPAHTVALLRRRNGAVAATYDDAPFGAVTETVPADSAVPANPFQWSSEVYDSELDLVYYNYRHYSPSDGRWLSRDPIEEQGGENLYGVCVNDCISKIDILGRAMRDDWLWFPPHREETVAVSFTAIIEITQSGLDIVGLIPVLGEVADGINGVVYICRGDTINAALSIGAMVPVGGQGATVEKVGLKWKNAYDVVQQDINPVSYTHLTLPTICSV